MLPKWVVLFEDGGVTYIRAPSKEHIRQRVGGVRSIFMMNRKTDGPEIIQVDKGEIDG